MDGLISVVVPVYNVEQYIEQSIDSIVSQSYKELEIILIDDGSTDQSGQICDRYAARDDRIRVIHQQNGGAASAKNAGLRIATGEFLAFVDSDDYLERDAYKYMVNVLNEYEADVVQCSFKDVYVDYEEDIIKLEQTEIFDTNQYLKRYTTDWTCGLLWDKLYKRELFEGILFEEGHKIDDEFFTYQGIMNATKIIHTPKIVYNYRKRKSSVMLSKDSQKRILLDKLDYLEKRRVNIAGRFPKLKYDFDFHYLNMLIILSKEHAVDEEIAEKIKQALRTYFNDKNCIKLNMRFRLILAKLQYSSANKIILNKKSEVLSDNTKQFFE